MRATFYGGPADGGELTLTEPIRGCLRFPLSCAEALEYLEPQHPDALLVPNHVPAHYVLEVDQAGAPVRDTAGRVMYRYRVPNPTPKETTSD